MDDLISRKEAIDRINKQREHLQPDIYPQDKIGDAAYRICAEFIERLPSAQPEPCNLPQFDATCDGDILVKGVKMPKGCVYEGEDGKTEYCFLCNHADVPFCMYLEWEPEAAIGIDERPCYCPLEPQEPCEDAVSRKYILNCLAEYIEEYGELDSNGLHDLKWCAMKEAEMVVKDAPSVISKQIECEDAVSREAVTDVIRHSDIFSTWYEMDDTDDIVAEVIDEARKQLVDDVNELPSVTPKCPECDDVVSRRAAIDVAENAFVRGLLASPDIRRLPSVQQERKTGWWMIREGISDAQCSECKMYFRDVYDMDNSDAFCRHCGTKMEGLKVVKNG